MRKFTSALVLLAGLWFGATAHAAFSTRTVACTQDTFDVSPRLSAIGEQVRVVVGKTGFDPVSLRSVVVFGDRVEVTFTGDLIGFLPTPVECLELVLDPLPIGQYTVALLVDQTGQPPQNQQVEVGRKYIRVTDGVLSECPSRLDSSYLGVQSLANSGDAIAITVGQYSYSAQSLTFAKNGTTIDATLGAYYLSPSPGGHECLSKTISGLPSGIYNVNFKLQELSVSVPPQLMKTKTIEVYGPPAELSGLWWNASESGWGVNLTQRGNNVFAVWYTYDGAGNPKWYVAPHCQMPGAGAVGRCVETLYEVNGPKFFGSGFNPAAAHVVDVGLLELAFINENTGTMKYTVTGQSRTVPITRQPMSSGATLPSVNYTDLWWNPEESGWGMAVTHQGGVMFLAWFVYDGAGKPVWYVASNCDVKTTGDGCDGTLYRTTGPALAKTFDASRVQVFAAGSVSLRFPDANNAVLEYTVDGVTSTKNIRRQIF